MIADVIVALLVIWNNDLFGCCIFRIFISIKKFEVARFTLLRTCVRTSSRSVLFSIRCLRSLFLPVCKVGGLFDTRDFASNVEQCVTSKRSRSRAARNKAFRRALKNLQPCAEAELNFSYCSLKKPSSNEPIYARSRQPHACAA